MIDYQKDPQFYRAWGHDLINVDTGKSLHSPDQMNNVVLCSDYVLLKSKYLKSIIALRLIAEAPMNPPVQNIASRCLMELS